MKKSLLFLLLIALLAAGGYAFLQYNKPHADTASEEPAYTLSAQELLRAYQNDEAQANARYLDQLIQVEGKLKHVLREESAEGEAQISLLIATDDPLSNISCSLLPEEADKAAALTEGQTVLIKGYCTGLLMDVVLVRCVLVEP